MSRRPARIQLASLALCAACVLSGCGGASAGQPARLAATTTGRRDPPTSQTLFAASSFWNTALAQDAPIDSQSASLVAGLGAVVADEVADKFGPWISTTGFSTPIYTVSARARTVRVTLDNRNPALQRAFDAVPIPPGARPATGTDAQLTVSQPSTDRLWEFWKMRDTPDGWHAKWGGAMRNVSHSPGYFGHSSWPGARSNWGASATSLPLAGGLITLADLKRGEIDHALALGFPLTEAGVYRFPAQRTDGTHTGPDAVPEGTRFRLDPQLDLTELHLPRLTAMVALAAQRYGIVVRDTSGVVDFYGQDPTPTGTDPFSVLFEGKRPWQLLAQFPWAALQVLEPHDP